jgi:hypothetical protein
MLSLRQRLLESGIDRCHRGGRKWQLSRHDVKRQDTSCPGLEALCGEIPW